MAQHFLLSAASRTLSLRKICKAGEDAAYETFCQMRWPETDGEAERISSLNCDPVVMRYLAPLLY